MIYRVMRDDIGENQGDEPNNEKYNENSTAGWTI